MERLSLLIVCAALMLILGQGCAPAQNQQTANEPAPSATDASPDDPTRQRDEQTVNHLASNPSGSATYVAYSEAAYETAKASGKPILLFFYANWCPTCKAEEPILRTAIQQTDGDLVAFRVNTLDSDTDEDEKALAKSFGVFIQHTFIFINRNGTPEDPIIGSQGEERLKSYIERIQ